MSRTDHLPLPDAQIVLVLQGGGALGAYQAGVYEGLHEAGIEPDWVIGTSIGAINGALIAGNAAAERLQRLRAFWSRVEQHSGLEFWPSVFGQGPGLPLHNGWANWNTVSRGLPAFFTPNPAAWAGVHANVGVEQAAWYQTAPLAKTLGGLVDFDRLCRAGCARRDGGESGERGPGTRLSVGAVNARSGRMRYFDSREMPLDVAHVMASGALPPAFPAVRIDGEPYWDGGIYSNTPIEAVLEDRPRRNSLIFAVNMWQPGGPEPESIWQVMGRQKDIQYASRADSHIARQQQIHHLRHIIRELAKELPAAKRNSPAVRELASWGCGTTMHVARLLAPRLDGEDHTKDIDFTPSGIRARWQAGFADAQRMLAQAPWKRPVDVMDGVVVHELHELHDSRPAPAR